MSLDWEWNKKLFDLTGTIVLFIAVNFLLNFEPVETAFQAFSRGLVQFLEDVRAGLLPRIVNLIIAVFKTIVHWVETLLHFVDDWLRFRQKDSRLSMVLRAISTVLWFPIAYLARFNMVVLIEPCLNPLKLPVASIATKFWLAIGPQILPNPKNYDFFTYAIYWWLVFWFPDLFGFLFWEIKENWSLYRANRSPTLKPMIMGPHGETLPALLRPGFHSGTIPKLFARLRKAERGAHQTGNWSAVRSYKANLEHVAKAVGQFLTRDFIALLAQHPYWLGESMTVGKVDLATNQIRVELVNLRYPETPVVLELEYRAAGCWPGSAASAGSGT